MTRGQLISAVANYFAEKGKYLTLVEYKQQPDIPVHPNLVFRLFGSWGRLPAQVQKFHPELHAVIQAGSVKKIAPIVEETDEV